MEELDRDEDLEEGQPDLDDKEVESDIHESIDLQYESIDRHPVHPDPQPSKPFEPILSRVYRPKPTFSPKNPKKAKEDLDKAICRKAFNKIVVEMPLSDAVKISPLIKKYMKDMVT